MISTLEAAPCLEVAERSVRRSALQGKYRYVYIPGKGRGGKKMMVVFESLPQAAQDRYHGIQQHNTMEEAAAVLPSLTDEQRKATCEKEKIVLMYRNFKENYPAANKQEAFLAGFNEKYPDKHLTAAMLSHWNRLYERDGISGLVDRRGGYNKGQSAIPEEAKDVFLKLFLQEKGTKHGGPAIAACYRMTQEFCTGLELPSISAFERLARSIPLPTKILYQQGRKAFDDLCVPTIRMDHSKLHTNQRWVADNHEFDVMVRFPDGHVGRPWIVAWIDQCSRYLAGYTVVPVSPCADDILEAFGYAVKSCGIPESVKLDNGKDYMAHDLFNREFPFSLANEIGIVVSNTIPYNARAKLIERFWETLEYGYLIFLDSYIGANPKRRPEKMQTVSDKLKDIAMPYSEFCEVIKHCIEKYNNTPHSGDAMNGRTPRQAFEEEITAPLRTANDTLLSYLFRRSSILLTVGKNGIRIPELGQYYNSAELFQYFGQKIYARYDISDIRQIYCHSENGEFLCMAESAVVGSLEQEITSRNMKKMNSVRKQILKSARDYRPAGSAPSIQQLAIEQGMSFSKPDLKALPTVPTADSDRQKRAEDSTEAKWRQEIQKSPEYAKAVQDKNEAMFKQMLGG